MPVQPDSRFASLPVLQVTAPDGSERRAIGLRLLKLPVEGPPTRVRVQPGEGLDALARRVLGDEGLWWRILDANPVIYPLDIKAGDLVKAPPPAPATRVTRARRF